MPVHLISPLIQMPLICSIQLLAKPKSLAVWAYLGVKPLDMPRTPYRASEENALNNPPCPFTPTLTLSTVHHTSHQLTKMQRFYRITMSLKWPFVPKSDVKQ